MRIQRRGRSAARPTSPVCGQSSGESAHSSCEFVIKNADYADWDALAKAMADRNGPHRDRRLIKAERRLLIGA